MGNAGTKTMSQDNKSEDNIIQNIIEESKKDVKIEGLENCKVKQSESTQDSVNEDNTIQKIKDDDKGKMLPQSNNAGTKTMSQDNKSEDNIIQNIIEESKKDVKVEGLENCKVKQSELTQNKIHRKEVTKEFQRINGNNEQMLPQSNIPE